MKLKMNQIWLWLKNCKLYNVLFDQVPRVGGIKKGWVKQFVVVCDFKLFLYDIREERNNVTASIVVNQVLDMRSVPIP